MIKINVHAQIDIFDIDIIGDCPIPKEKVMNAVDQLFRGYLGEYLICCEYEEPFLKVKEFYFIDMTDSVIEKNFEEHYLKQTGGWWGVDIISVFNW